MSTIPLPGKRRNISFLESRARCAMMALLLGCFMAPVCLAQTGNPDPWEGFNRAMYSFNEGADRYVLKPVAKAYKLVMPDIAEQGVTNVFRNLGEVRNATHHLLQGKGYSSANSAGRFLLNSTVGIAGLFDVADGMGLERGAAEDLGQTLAVWGVDSGPYLILPLLGPSTLRDSPSRYADRFLDPVIYLEDVGARNALRVTELIDLRARYLDADRALPANDPYSFAREAWFQRRDYEIRDGEIEDEFGGEGFDDFLD